MVEPWNRCEMMSIALFLLAEALSLHADWVTAATTGQGRRPAMPVNQTEDGGRMRRHSKRGAAMAIQQGSDCLCVLPPQSNVRLVMSIVGLLAITWDVVFIPVQAFESVSPTFQEVLQVATILVFGYWILDFVLQFFSAPDPWLEIPAISRREGRLLRLSRVQKTLVSILTRFTSVYFWMAMQMMKGIVIILVINHYVTIGWLVLGVYYPGHTWLEEFQLADKGFSEQYVYSFHWAIAQSLGCDLRLGGRELPECELEPASDP
eukprot:g23179.t1